MENYRTYKYLLHPTEFQIGAINDIIAKCAFLRTQYKKDISEHKELPRENKLILEYYRNKFPELKECDTSALTNEIFKVKDETERRIKRIRNSYTTNYYDYLKEHYPLSNDEIFLSRVGWVKKCRCRPIPKGVNIRNFTVTKEEKNKYYVLINITLPENSKRILNPDLIIGFDYSSTHFLVDSDGDIHDIPHFYRRQLYKLRKKQQELVHRKKGSYRSRELIRQIHKTHKKIRNQRRDYLKKLSHQVAEQYDYVAIETLEMKQIARTHKLQNATRDNSFYLFTSMLEYKMNERKKKLIKVDKYFPSTKKCSVCGYIKKDIDLDTRTWVCPECHSVLDRDINAAINIREEGKRLVLAGGQLARHRA